MTCVTLQKHSLQHTDTRNHVGDHSKSKLRSVRDAGRDAEKGTHKNAVFFRPLMGFTYRREVQWRRIIYIYRYVYTIDTGWRRRLMNDLTVSARRKSYFAGVRTLNLYIFVRAGSCFSGHKSKCVLRRRTSPPPGTARFALHHRRRPHDVCDGSKRSRRYRARSFPAAVRLRRPNWKFIHAQISIGTAGTESYPPPPPSL